MHHFIVFIRHLRRIAAFEISTRMLVVLLMVTGAWVATRTLDIPVLHSIGDKVIHMIVFFGFALLMDLATDRKPFWLWKGLPLLTYGAIIEILQYFTPDREFSVLDWLADFFGVFLYFVLKMGLLWWDARSTKVSQSNKEKCTT